MPEDCVLALDNCCVHIIAVKVVTCCNAMFPMHRFSIHRYAFVSHHPAPPRHSNTYSALNALAGHYNSFGTNAPIPKKRLERIEKELGDAEKLLQRGR